MPYHRRTVSSNVVLKGLGELLEGGAFILENVKIGKICVNNYPQRSGVDSLCGLINIFLS